MLDWSDDEDCCLNCEDKICHHGKWCRHCLCKKCENYEFDPEKHRGYCNLRRDEAADEDDFDEDDDDFEVKVRRL